ncbi:hypothetical protein FRC01_004108 [Tulasnella sp. 417]|nr:hypothetical protein FRC01_004108 [Tulasnella sp. 417]
MHAPRSRAAAVTTTPQSRDPAAVKIPMLPDSRDSLEALMRSSLTGGNGFGHPKAPPLSGIRSPSVAEYYTPASLVPQTPVPGEHLPGPSSSSSSFYRGEHPSPYRNDYSAYRSESSFRPSDQYRRGPDGDIEMGRHDDSRYPAPTSSSSSSFPSYTSTLPPPLPPSSGRDHISITHQGSSLGITTTSRIQSPVPYNHPTPTVSNSSGNDTSDSSPPPFVGTALTESSSYMPMALCGPSDYSNSTITVGRDLGLPASGVAEVLPDLPVLHPSWPLYLPPPALLNHLVDTFFACVPHAGKLLHRTKFLASLEQSPDSPDFPLPALLHAICALASIYTSVIDGPRLPPIDDIQVEERFSHDWKEIRANQSFGETHAVWATQESVKVMDKPGSMIQIMQGYGSLDQAKSSPFVVLPPKDASEREERRNIAWLMYASERLSAAQTSWAQLLDDADISQFLPLSEGDFASGRDYPFEIRQRLASPNCLFSHPPLLTSPFSLLIKSVNLLSRVKAFNIRFRNKYADDLPSIDPRSTSDFLELDDLIERFKTSWPKEYKDGGVSEDGKVDPTLYLAAMLPSVATILLHDPHADMASSDCASAKKIQEAIGSIMGSIYKITSTSFDIMLLDHFSSFCWFLAGAALIRILKAKISAGAVVDVIKINSEIEIIRHILLRLSEKTLIGRRQVKLLNEHYDREIGIQPAAIEEATPSPIASAPSESSTSVTSGRSKLRVSELLNFTSTGVPEVRPPNVGGLFDRPPSRSME